MRLLLFTIVLPLVFSLKCNSPMDTYRVYNELGDNTGIGCVYANSSGTPRYAIYIEGKYKDTPYRVLAYLDASGSSFAGRAITPANPGEAALDGPIDITATVDSTGANITLKNAAAPSGTGATTQQLTSILMQKVDNVTFTKLPKLASCGAGNQLYSMGSGTTIEYRCVVSTSAGAVKAGIGPGLWGGANYIRIMVVHDSKGFASSDRCFNEGIAENCGIHNYDTGIKSVTNNSDGSLSFGSDKYSKAAVSVVPW